MQVFAGLERLKVERFTIACGLAECGQDRSVAISRPSLRAVFIYLCESVGSGRGT